MPPAHVLKTDLEFAIKATDFPSGEMAKLDTLQYSLPPTSSQEAYQTCRVKMEKKSRIEIMMFLDMKKEKRK